MRIVSALLLLLWPITAVSFEVLCGNGLIVKAEIDKSVEKIGIFRQVVIGNSIPKIYGDIKVVNEGKLPKLFSSRFLMLRLSEGTDLRAY